LQTITDPPQTSPEAFTLIAGVADPERPIGAEDMIADMFGGYVPARNFSTVVKVILAASVILALAFVWHFVPLANPEAVRATLTSIAGNPFAPLVVIAIFVVAGSLMFPVTVLIAATAAAFGPWLGFAYACVGALTSALATYAIGAAIGRRTLRDFLGPKLNRIRQQVARRGIIAVAAVRMVPVAPFAVVNLVAGASSIRVFDYVTGTMLGMLPGLIAISAVGNQFARMISSPTPYDIAILAIAVAAWVALSIGIQAAVARYWGDGR
jgi:uncharacterized membrane protein YdjX (TVP38/TMEM64 family)